MIPLCKLRTANDFYSLNYQQLVTIYMHDCRSADTSLLLRTHCQTHVFMSDYYISLLMLALYIWCKVIKGSDQDHVSKFVTYKKNSANWLPCKSTLGMDSDRIRTDTNSDVTIYNIYFKFGYKYEYYWIRIQNRYFKFAFEHLLDL
jgi:hypothetical protein